MRGLGASAAAGYPGRPLPVATLAAAGSYLKDHAETELAEVVLVGLDELDDVALTILVEAGAFEQAGGDHLADADDIVALGLHGQVDVVSAGDEGFQVRGELMAAVDHVIEIEVGDEHDRAVELEALGEELGRLLVDQLTLGEVADDSPVGGVQDRLEEGQGRVVEEHRVGVVEHQDVALVAVLVEELKQAGGLDVAFDDAVVGDQVGLQLLLDAEGFTEARRAGDDEGSDVAVDGRLGHLLQDLEPFGDASVDLVVGLGLDRLLDKSQVLDVGHAVESVDPRFANVNSTRHMVSSLGSVDRWIIPGSGQM